MARTCRTSPAFILHVRLQLPVVALAFSCVAWAQSDSLAAFNTTLEGVVAKVAPAVVEVQATGQSTRFEDGNDDDNSNSTPSKSERFIGSGVILDSSGYIVTNAHVVSGAKSLTVKLDKDATQGSRPDETSSTTFPARLIGEFKEADLAVLKVEAAELPTISFNTNENLRPGQLVVALGSPAGLQGSISIGVVSTAGRQITPDGHVAYVQTDAAINPGNSGGPLVDIRGQLVGINSFFITQGGGSEGLGFAIPSRLVKFVYETIRRTGRVSWADIGVRVQGVTPTLSLGLRLPRDSGVVVSDVIPGTAAEQLGIKAGDFLSTIDGQPVENLPKYYEVMYHKGMGDKVALNLIRDSHRISLEIPITASMGDVDHAAAESNPPSNLVPKLGILCSEVGTMPRIETAQLRSKTGVLVEAKAVGGDMQANLMAGDVIHSVNLTSISNVAQLQTVLDQVKSGTPIVLQVERKSQFLYVPVDEN